MSEQLQQIRKKLYLHRDGASVASMREKGVNYKINFGVPVITLQKIAQEYAPNHFLANELWEHDNRELKILATMIQDTTSFQDANIWINDISSVELAEQSVMNLFSKLPEAIDLAAQWTFSEKKYIQLSGFLLYTRLFIQNNVEIDEDKFYKAIFQALNNDSFLIKNAALNSLRCLSRKFPVKISSILSRIKDSAILDADLKDKLQEEFLLEQSDLFS